MSQPIQEENKALVLEAFDTLFNSRDYAPVPGGSPSFATLAAAAHGSTFLDVHDSLGVTHTVTTYFFHKGTGQWQANSYYARQDLNLQPLASEGNVTALHL